MSTPRLVVSAAHTSASPGAIFKDLREFDLTRKILDKLLPHLTKEKIEHKAVPADLNLLKRIDWINDTGYTEENGDLFLEIHINDGNKRGLEG
jgi:N-acetylmuramoyl-L-alanine amidase